MAVRPLRPATDRRLGEPLPHQLANRTRAPPEAACAFGPQATSGISRSFPRLFRTSGQVPTRYSPVRHSRVATSVRLACVRHAASVRSEPGSNSQVNGRAGEPARQSTRARTCHSVTRTPHSRGRSRRPRGTLSKRSASAWRVRGPTRAAACASLPTDSLFKQRHRERAREGAPVGKGAVSTPHPTPSQASHPGLLKSLGTATERLESTEKTG